MTDDQNINRTRTYSTSRKVPSKRPFLEVFGPLKKVNNKLIEFFVVEPVEMTHPMGGVAQGKMQLEQKCEPGKITKRPGRLHGCIGDHLYGCR